MPPQITGSPPQTETEPHALFVVLPDTAKSFLQAASRHLLATKNASARFLQPGAYDIELIDEIAPSETVLISMTLAERLNLLRSHPGMRIVPVEMLRPLWLQRSDISPTFGPAASLKKTIDVKVIDAVTGAPLRNVNVVGLLDRAERMGALNRTNGKGIATLLFGMNASVLESIEAFAPRGYWPACQIGVNLADAGTVTLACTPIDLSTPDARVKLGLQGELTDGTGVKVALIDSGVSRHPDLSVTRGINLVKGESARSYADLLGHGTHVAGIIAGRGSPGTGVRGVAPGVALHVYRVFGKDQERALSFNIAKGIRHAVDDGCDLINLSLGGASDVPDVLREIQRARALGVVCIAAAGNDYRASVNYPARYGPVLAISAFGRRGTFPAGAAQELEAVKPFGKNLKNFLAAFSNIGSEIDLTGPGVGIVSACPGGYAVMDGTSMACPAVTGTLARALGRENAILRMDRNQERSDAIVKLALSAAKPLGFGPRFEGAGLLL